MPLEILKKAIDFKTKREKRFHHPNLDELQGWKSLKDEENIPKERLNEEKSWALKMGLTGADSLEDRSIPTFSRGELPHFAGINTFLKAPYAENVEDVKHYDATILGAPFDLSLIHI